jgi:hypothetical protein
MKPPGQLQWIATPIERRGRRIDAFSAQTLRFTEAQSFVSAHWREVYAAGASIFLQHVPLVRGDREWTTPTGLVIYDWVEQPPIVWFLPFRVFADCWEVARDMGFRCPKVNSVVLRECDDFLDDLSSREPIGIEAVGEQMATFRRFPDGGAFKIGDMRRACELNLRVLGGPQDESHTDKGLPRHFVRESFFYFGM